MRQSVTWMIGLLAVFVLSGCATQGPLEGWTTLLDGERGLENWNRTGEGNWRAAQGAIQIDGKTNKEANGERAVEVDNNAFPAGPIGLQYNSGTLRFRKVLIRPL
jgi:hypothetical protein